MAESVTASVATSDDHKQQQQQQQPNLRPRKKARCDKTPLQELTEFNCRPIAFTPGVSDLFDMLKPILEECARFPDAVTQIVAEFKDYLPINAIAVVPTYGKYDRVFFFNSISPGDCNTMMRDPIPRRPPLCIESTNWQTTMQHAQDLRRMYPSSDDREGARIYLVRGPPKKKKPGFVKATQDELEPDLSSLAGVAVCCRTASHAILQRSETDALAAFLMYQQYIYHNELERAELLEDKYDGPLPYCAHAWAPGLDNSDDGGEEDAAECPCGINYVCSPGCEKHDDGCACTVSLCDECTENSHYIGHNTRCETCDKKILICKSKACESCAKLCCSGCFIHHDRTELCLRCSNAEDERISAEIERRGGVRAEINKGARKRKHAETRNTEPTSGSETSDSE